jgi:pimeloyl-ACP methyl ester carboxylesterase
MSETSVTVDGVRSPPLEFGPSDVGEAVVFVHGNPGSTFDWERLAPISQTLVNDLAGGAFLAQQRNVVLVG